MITQMSAALVWFAGLIGWYIIRYPFARRAKKIRVSKSLFDWRESGILAFALLGLLVIPAVYALIGFPARLDRPFIPAVAWLGLAPLCAALWLFRRSHVDLGRNWSISLEIREQHALVKTGVYRFIRHRCILRFSSWVWRKCSCCRIACGRIRTHWCRRPLRSSRSTQGKLDARMLWQ